MSYRSYLERLNRLLALHLDNFPVLPNEDVQQLAALVRDLREWGLGEYLAPIERSLAIVLRA